MKFDQWTTELLDSISTGICIIGQEYRVYFWNDFMRFYSGISGEDILGRRIDDFFPEFNREYYRENIDLIFLGWPPLFYSSRLNKLFNRSNVGPERTTIYLDVTITALSVVSEDESLALITVSDVTDLNRKLEERNQLYKTSQEEVRKRMETEEMLRSSEANLRGLNEMKDKLLSIIGHDLRSPLSTNINGLEAIINNYDMLEDEKRKELMGMLLNGSREVLNLLEDLLAWARQSSNSSNVKLSAFDIKPFLEDELERIQPVALDKGIDLLQEAVQEVTVMADKNMIKTVIRNLVFNAVKFTERGGKITVYTEVSAGRVHISVQDTGVGMSSEVVNKLFKIDELVSTRGTNNEKGFGFGLVLAKEFIEKNNGSISVSSVPGEGSTIGFSLPLATTS